MRSLDRLEKLIKNIGLPDDVRSDLVKYFFQIRDDLRTANLEKSSAGKFVETIVQVFQALDSKRSGYDSSVKNVERELNQVYEQNPVRNIPDDSRLGIVRMARVIYCLRSKRSIIHKNGIDPNKFDLELIFHGSQWIMAELVRLSTQVSIDEAKRLIEEILQPICPFVVTILGRPLVLADGVTVDEEILLIMGDQQKNDYLMTRREIGTALNRRSSSSISHAITRLWTLKQIEGDSKTGFCLTDTGIKRKMSILKRLGEGKTS